MNILVVMVSWSKLWKGRTIDTYNCIMQEVVGISVLTQ